MRNQGFYEGNKYKDKNEDFIIENSGMYRYRTLRVHLLNKHSTNQFYDIIVKKNIKLTEREKKRELIRELKAQLGALSEEEKNETEEKESIFQIFRNNIYYYENLEELLVDLNFKSYLKNNYNAVFNSKGIEINNFQELEDDENLYLCVISFDEDHKRFEKNIQSIEEIKKTPTIYYSEYKSILSKKEIQFSLKNFSGSNEFINDGRMSNRNEKEVFPLILKDQRKRFNQEFAYKMYLNKVPLRKKIKNISILPQLPQRLLCNLQFFKSSELMHYFLNKFMHATIITPFRKSRSKSISKSKDKYNNSADLLDDHFFYKYDDGISEGQNQKEDNLTPQIHKKLMKFMEGKNMENKLIIESSRLIKQRKIIPHSKGKIVFKDFQLRNAFEKSNDEKKSNLLQNQFKLLEKIQSKSKKIDSFRKQMNHHFNEFSAKDIKEKIDSKIFEGKEGIYGSLYFQKEQERQDNMLILKPNEIKAIFNKNKFIRSILSKYRYTPESFELIFRNFAFLNKVTKYLLSKCNCSFKNPHKMLIPECSKEMIRSTLRIMELKTSEYSEFLRFESYENLIYIHLIKEHYPIFKIKKTSIYSKLLGSIGIYLGKEWMINLETLVKIHYYYIDNRFNKSELIDFVINV